MLKEESSRESRGQRGSEGPDGTEAANATHGGVGSPAVFKGHKQGIEWRAARWAAKSRVEGGLGREWLQAGDPWPGLAWRRGHRAQRTLPGLAGGHAEPGHAQKS